MFHHVLPFYQPFPLPLPPEFPVVTPDLTFIEPCRWLRNPHPHPLQIAGYGRLHPAPPLPVAAAAAASLCPSLSSCLCTFHRPCPCLCPPPSPLLDHLSPGGYRKSIPPLPMVSDIQTELAASNMAAFSVAKELPSPWQRRRLQLIDVVKSGQIRETEVERALPVAAAKGTFAPEGESPWRPFSGKCRPSPPVAYPSIFSSSSSSSSSSSRDQQSADDSAAGQGIVHPHPSPGILLTHRRTNVATHFRSQTQPEVNLLPIISGVLLGKRRCTRCRCPNCQVAPPTGSGGDRAKRKHVCHYPGCRKLYGKTSHLRAHLRWHVGDRPFRCRWLFCRKSFTRSDELQRHLKTHTGDKRYLCPLCCKRFMRSDHLKKHLNTHQMRDRTARTSPPSSSSSTSLATAATTTTTTRTTAAAAAKTRK